MPRLRALKSKEDIAKVPTTEPVLIDVGEEPEAPAVAAQEENKGTPPPVTPPAPVQAAQPPERDDDKIALQKRLDELERAEKVQKEAIAAAEKRANDALRRQQEIEAQLAQEQDRSFQSQYDATIADLAAAQAEGDSAQHDLETAQSNGDFKTAAEAQRRLSRAESRVDRLEIEKATIERKIEQKKAEPPQKTQTDPFESAIANLPDAAKTWLRAHPSYITEQKKNVKLQSAHFDALDAGHEMASPEYFEVLETKLGLKKAPAKDPEPEEEEVAVVSAPPTRETPSMVNGQKPSSTKVTLTPEERELCKINNIPEIEYARNKLKMIQAKKDGYLQ